MIAGAAGGLFSGVAIWAKAGKPDLSMIGNGVLAGLVAITAGCGTVNPFGSLVIGGIAGVLVVFAVLFIDRIHIDDPVGAVSVHGVCGIWGVLAVGLFAQYDDAFLGRERPDSSTAAASISWQCRSSWCSSSSPGSARRR